jgi:hypothetical protein
MIHCLPQSTLPPFQNLSADKSPALSDNFGNFQRRITFALASTFPICRHRSGRTPHYNENTIDIFPEKELRGLSSNFNIHVSASDLYIPRIGPHIFLQQDRQTEGGNV